MEEVLKKRKFWWKWRSPFHVEKLPKLTEKEILGHAFSVERNSFRQKANIPDDIFFNFNEIATFYEKVQFI